MKVILFVGLAVTVGVLACACSKPEAPPPPSWGAETSEDAVTVIVGCAKCVYSSDSQLISHSPYSLSQLISHCVSNKKMCRAARLDGFRAVASR